jgi:probable F420-dependent oxidoreductase
MAMRAELAKTAEAAGFTGFTVGDHIVTPAEILSPYPYTADGKVHWDPTVLFPDPWQTIAVMATATPTLQFMTSIYILPLRDTFTVAKALSTAAVITNDRVILGAGVGWMKDEYLLTGQSFETRGARADEMIDVIQALLAGGMVEYHGRFHDFPPVQMSPLPTRPVPIVIGGDSPAALKRAARNDGWMTAPHKVDDFGALVDRFRAAQREVGRVGADARIVALLAEETDLGGIRRLQDWGISDVIFPYAPLTGGIDPTLDDYKRLIEGRAETIIRHFG